ncbi:hypothetical protein D9M71_599580 [compost metagenome]
MRLVLGALDPGRAYAADVVAFALALDLDHLGAKVSEDLPSVGAGDHSGHVENADTAEYFRGDVVHGHTAMVYPPLTERTWPVM